MPAPIFKKFSAAIADALKVSEVAQRLSADGSTPMGSSPEQFSAHVRSEIVKWRKLANEGNLVLH